MAEGEWQIQAGYDYRFGAVQLVLRRGQEEPVQVVFRLPDFLRQLGVPQHELAAYLAEAADMPQSTIDIEPVRQQVLRETNLAGKVVLDVGGYDGKMAQLAMECGAARAICLDNHQYEHYGWKEFKYPNVEYVRGDMMELHSCWYGDAMTGEPGVALIDEGKAPLFDVIIFFNVLYHLKNPWAALDHLRTLLKPDGEMLLCTLHRYHEGPWVYLYEPRECNPTDDTVYWGPSTAAIERLLALTGWECQQEGLALDRVVYRCKPKEGFVRTHEDT